MEGRTLYVITLEALGGFPDGPATPDVRDLLGALASQQEVQPGSLEIILLTDLMSNRGGDVAAWMDEHQVDPRVEPVFRQDRFGVTNLQGYKVQWLKEALRKRRGIARVVYYATARDIDDNLQSLVASLPEAVRFEILHVKEGLVHRFSV